MDDKMNKIIMVGIIIMMLLVMLSGCTEQSSYEGQNKNNVVPKNPDIYVTSDLWRSGYEGIDYVVWIDVVVRNGGYSGCQTVFCQINQDNNQYLRSERVCLGGGGSTSLTFRFPEFSWWSSDSGSYRIWVV